MKVKTQSHSGANARRRCGRSLQAYSLAEILISMAITVMSLGGVVSGYIFSTRQAEWSAYSLAAQALASQRLEQMRAAKWDLRGSPIVDELTTSNFPTIANHILDIPASGTNIAYARSITTISNVVSGGYDLKLIRVDCLWSFGQRTYSNTVVTCRAPDQ